MWLELSGQMYRRTKPATACSNAAKSKAYHSNLWIIGAVVGPVSLFPREAEADSFKRDSSYDSSIKNGGTDVKQIAKKKLRPVFNEEF